MTIVEVTLRASALSVEALSGRQAVAGRIGLAVSSDAVRGAATTVSRVSAAADIGPVEPVRVPFADASPAEVREALTAEDAASFDRQWQALMGRATERLDLTEVHEALETWRQVAWVTSTHGTALLDRLVWVSRGVLEEQVAELHPERHAAVATQIRELIGN